MLSSTLRNKHKGSDLASIDPETGALTLLYHPRRERWWEHFQIDAGELVPLTVRLLRLNHPDRVVERELLISAGLIRPPVVSAGQGAGSAGSSGTAAVRVCRKMTTAVI